MWWSYYWYRNRVIWWVSWIKKDKSWIEEKTIFTWDYWVWQAGVLNDAVEILKSYDPKNVEILTRVHSLQEARAKINYFREKKVRNNVIIVPDGIAKSSVVDPFQNVLVEDSNGNLDDWHTNHGIAIYYGTGESVYPAVTSLETVLNDEKFKSLVKKM